MGEPALSARCGIVLHPAGHTLSPVLHEEAYAELGLDATFEVFDVPAATFAKALAGLRADGVRQLAISLPHKQTALTLADEASEAARAIGAANTLTAIEGRLLAENTDWVGVTRALEAHGPLAGARASVLGAGGAARAVVFALVRLGARVTVVNRSAGRAVRLAEELGAEVGTLDADFDLLVNATPVGMHPAVADSPVPPERLRRGALVFDTVYRPLETRLLRDARAAGARTQDGLAMLVHQAVEQVRIWSGRAPSAERLRAAALRALQSEPPAAPC